MEDVVSNLRGRASFEQPFAKDAAITLPGDDRDRIALLELKMGRTHNGPSLIASKRRGAVPPRL